MSQYMGGYRSGQHDAFNWLMGGDDGDVPLAPIDIEIQPKAWAWCLATNLRWAAALTESFDLGEESARWWSSYFEGYYLNGEPEPWSPGCGRNALDIHGDGEMDGGRK